MNILKTVAWGAVFLVFLFAISSGAHASCFTFNQLTNGNIANADPVMANFNMLLTCPTFSGPVGIGTTGPGATLTINVTANASKEGFGGGVAGSTGLMISDGSDGNNGLYGLNLFAASRSGGGILGWGWSGLGVNTYYDNTNNVLKRFTSSGGFVNSSFMAFSPDSASSNGAISFWTGSAGDPNNRLTILSGGNVGIGTISPSYLLHVNGTGYATSWQQGSDRRLKEDIRFLAFDALAKIMALHPVTFRWKAPKDDGMQGIQMGLIAQDVEKLLPTAVLTTRDASKTKSLKYNELTAVLIKAMQEQQVMIENQAQRIRALSRKSANLEVRLKHLEVGRIASAR